MTHNSSISHDIATIVMGDTKMDKKYILASQRTWGLEAFLTARSTLPGEWTVVVDPADLAKIVECIKPRYIFFPHWSDIVPQFILENNECVCFHMADLPYGRGGSPLQNLIVRGHTETVLTALRMSNKIDAGPVYMKKPLSLDGSAKDIFDRAGGLAMQMMKEIVDLEPVPQPQLGEPTAFRRRHPDQSALPDDPTPKQLYDHIRMLDAPGYPSAFIEFGQWKAEFSEARLNGDSVEGHVRFSRQSKQ